jgi:ankyrin repeat protein
LNTGATPLLRAAQTFDNDVVRAVLEHHALVDLVRFLLNHGARVDAMGDSGKALLTAARGNAEIAAMIRAAMPAGANADRPRPGR